MSRRILTQSSIEEMLAPGSTEILLEPGDIVTALARDYALQQGIRLVEAGQQPTRAAAPAEAATAPAGSTAQNIDAAAVRKAVINAVGYTPDGLDAIIARVMK